MNSPTITDVRALLVRLPLKSPLTGPFGVMEARHNLIAVVRTSGGIEGIGEIWANFPPWGCTERVAILEQVIAPSLKDQKLDDPARLYRELKERLRLLANQWGAPGPVHQALAGVDMALWDAHARHLGLPLSDVLAGKACARKVPVYASGIGYGNTTELIRDAMDRGHSRFKIRTSCGPEGNRALLREAREAAGDCALMADANQTLSLTDLQELEDEIRAARLQWLEEPFPIDDDASYRAWPIINELPLALGENERGLDGITAIMDAYDPSILQPDITKTAGITEGLEIAHAVVARGKRLCFHMFGGAVGLYGTAHLAAAVEGADWLEMDANPNPLYEKTVNFRPTVEEDQLILTNEAGIGIELNPDIDAKWAA